MALDDINGQCPAPAQVMWQNLCLLGFSPFTVEKKSRTGILFGPDMFNRGSNSKCLSIVLYFLFDRLNPVKAKKDFAGVWPSLDQKQDQEFFSIALQLLVEFEKDGSLPRGTSLRSYLNFGVGTRLVNLVWKFSEYVLRQVFAREFSDSCPCTLYQSPDPLSMSMPLLTAHVVALQGQVAYQNYLLSNSLHSAYNEGGKLQEMVDQFSVAARHSSQELDTMKSKVSDFATSSKADERFSEIANLERTHRIEVSKGIWEEISDVVSKVTEDKDILQLLCTDQQGISLDHAPESGACQDLIKVIDDFTDSFEKLFACCSDSRDVVSVLVTELSDDCVWAAQNVSNASSQLKNASNLESTISELIPKISASIGSLRNQVSTVASPVHPGATSSTTSSPDCNRMKLVPPTPLNRLVLPSETPLKSSKFDRDLSEKETITNLASSARKFAAKPHLAQLENRRKLNFGGIPTPQRPKRNEIGR